MICSTNREKLTAYLDSELTAAEHEALSAHLAGCETCRQELAGLWQTQALLKRTVATVADHVAAPPDAWAKLQTRIKQEKIGAPGTNHKRSNKTLKVVQPHSKQIFSLPLIAMLGAAAVVVLGIGLVAAAFLMNGPSLATNDPTPTLAQLLAEATTQPPEAIAAVETVTTEPSATPHPRPQSGGGSQDTEGPYNAPDMTWAGTIQALDPATGLITLEDGKVAQTMGFTEYRIEDITWYGALTTFDALQVGQYIQIDLLATEPDPPFALLIWIKWTEPPFYQDGQHALYTGKVMSFDPVTGIFTIEPIAEERFQLTAETRYILDDDTQIDGQPAGPEIVQVGKMLEFVTVMDSGNPAQVALVIGQPEGKPPVSWTLLRGKITAITDNQITIQDGGEGGPEIPVEIGPPGFAEAQGVHFEVGDLVVIRGYFNDNGKMFPVDIIRVLTGQWLRLRDENGPLW